MTILLVGGDFGGTPRASGFVAKLAAGLKDYTAVTIHNGGTIDELRALLDNLTLYEAICWMPNISNTEEKLLPQIKKLHPTCLLVSSKNNTDGQYLPLDLIGRALFSHSNLLLELVKSQHKTYTVADQGIKATIWDPLGNVYVQDELDINKIAAALARRLQGLAEFTRVGSVSCGAAVTVPDNEPFFKHCRQYADRYHELIHGVHPNRFLGNASFRCTNGFPAFRGSDKLIYVTKRNLDKRMLCSAGFVAITPYHELTPKLVYYGTDKPSVDAPLQQLLFDIYPWASYMLHAHVYIKDARMTRYTIPCGAVEEVDEIVRLFSEQDGKHPILVNLRGHGSLVIAAHITQLEDIPYVGRPFPELHNWCDIDW